MIFSLFNVENCFHKTNGLPNRKKKIIFFADIFLLLYELESKEISVFRYINDWILFNRYNFEELSNKIYPRDLILNRTDMENIISFLDLATKSTLVYMIKKKKKKKL